MANITPIRDAWLDGFQGDANQAALIGMSVAALVQPLGFSAFGETMNGKLRIVLCKIGTEKAAEPHPKTNVHIIEGNKKDD